MRFAQKVAKQACRFITMTPGSGSYRQHLAALISAAYAPVLAERDALREALRGITARIQHESSYENKVWGDQRDKYHCVQWCLRCEAEAALKGSK
jgi:hypothetical protein